LLHLVGSSVLLYLNKKIFVIKFGISVVINITATAVRFLPVQCYTS